MTDEELDALEAEYSLEGRTHSFPYERDVLRLVAEVRQLQHQLDDEYDGPLQHADER